MGPTHFRRGNPKVLWIWWRVGVHPSPQDSTQITNSSGSFVIRDTSSRRYFCKFSARERIENIRILMFHPSRFYGKTNSSRSRFSGAHFHYTYYSCSKKTSWQATELLLSSRCLSSQISSRGPGEIYFLGESRNINLPKRFFWLPISPICSGEVFYLILGRRKARWALGLGQFLSRRGKRLKVNYEEEGAFEVVKV